MSTECSRESWEKQKLQLTRLQKRVYECLLTFKDGACCWEIMERFGTRNPNEVAPKLSKLMEYGLIYESEEKRKCPYSNRSHSVYKDTGSFFITRKPNHILNAVLKNGQIVIDVPSKIMKKLERGLRANITIKLVDSDECSFGVNYGG